MKRLRSTAKSSKDWRWCATDQEQSDGTPKLLLEKREGETKVEKGHASSRMLFSIVALFCTKNIFWIMLKTTVHYVFSSEEIRANRETRCGASV